MKNEIKIDRTERGFKYGKFFDCNGIPCSIQKSSLATEDCIWLGVDNAQKHAVYIPEGGSGWRPIPFPKGNICIHDRMHLTRDQVKTLLPLLQYFVRTGELPSNKKVKPIKDPYPCGTSFSKKPCSTDCPECNNRLPIEQDWDQFFNKKDEVILAMVPHYKQNQTNLTNDCGYTTGYKDRLIGKVAKYILGDENAADSVQHEEFIVDYIKGYNN